jgi:methylmalonyl-CoA/ethylmalonyl-CoA epimerase
LDYDIKTQKVTNSRQQVNVIFIEKKGSIDIKLIEPSNVDSPLWAFIKKGGGLHHICFFTEDVSKTTESMKEKGAIVVAEPEPGEAFDDELISFLYLGAGLNIELIDTKKRKSQIT